MTIEYINYKNVSNPAALEKLLNNFAKEIAELRTIANELKTDYNAHTHDVGGTTSSGLSASVSSDAVSQYIDYGV